MRRCVRDTTEVVGVHVIDPRDNPNDPPVNCGNAVSRLRHTKGRLERDRPEETQPGYHIVGQPEHLMPGWIWWREPEPSLVSCGGLGTVGRRSIGRVRSSNDDGVVVGGGV